MKTIYKYLIAIAIIAVGITLFFNKVYIPKTTYATTSAKKGDLSVKVFGIGTVDAKSIYKINSFVSAKISNLYMDEGKWVKKGELLATFDSIDLPFIIKESKISVEKASSEVIASQKELDSLRAQKHLAQVTYDRYAKLKKQSFASQSEYDKAKADLGAIDAQIKATKAHIVSAQMEVKRVKQALLALREKLTRYSLYAPVSGYVISKDAEVSQSVTPSQIIFQIVDPKDVWIKARIDEKISSNIKVNQKASIKLRSQDNKSYDAYVKRVAAKSDAVTQEREVDVAFENLPIPFYMNEQAEVLIQTREIKDKYILPAELLIYRDDAVGVWVKKGDKAYLQTIKLIAISDGKAAVEGLDSGVKLLVSSSKNRALKEGMRVH